MAPIILTLLVGAASAEDWAQFRGPAGAGITREANLPIAWSATENVRWKADLPGRGVSSPVIVGDRVYVTASSGNKDDRLHVLCFDRATGKKRWTRSFWATGNTVSHPKTCMAAATPVASENGVFALFASGDLFCLDPDGGLRWCRTLTSDYPAITNQIGMASSPILVGDVLVLTMENPGESFAAGIDAVTGKNRWKIARPKESNWTTPVVWTRDGKPEVILQSGLKVSGHDPKSGEERWSWSETELARIASPAAAPGVILVPTRDELLALKPGAKTELRWRSPKLKATTATPLVLEGKVYTVNSAGVLACAEVETANILWQERVKGPFSASPIVSGDRMYLVNEQGLTTVVQLGEKGKLLGTNALDAVILATPAVAPGALVLRSDKHLICVGK